MANNDVVLEGALLKAAVRAAEAPVSGELVRRNLARQLGLDLLGEVDLRDANPHPTILPQLEQASEPGAQATMRGHDE